MPVERTFLPKSGARIKALQRMDYMAADVFVMLFTSDWTPTELSVLADYIAHEATFSGYARAEIAMDKIELLGASAYLIFSNALATFTHSAGIVGNDIGGMAILIQTAAGPPAVYDLGPVTTFAEAVGMNQLDDTISRVMSEVEGN